MNQQSTWLSGSTPWIFSVSPHAACAPALAKPNTSAKKRRVPAISTVFSPIWKKVRSAMGEPLQVRREGAASVAGGNSTPTTRGLPQIGIGRAAILLCRTDAGRVDLDHSWGRRRAPATDIEQIA